MKTVIINDYLVKAVFSVNFINFFNALTIKMDPFIKFNREVTFMKTIAINDYFIKTVYILNKFFSYPL